MALPVTEEHIQLADSVRDFTAHYASVAETRLHLSRYAAGDRPKHWDALVAQGLHRIHIDEADGGDGGSLVDLAVVVEETGRALLPGPFLPTVTASAAVTTAAAGVRRSEVLRCFADGTTGAVVLPGSGITARREAQGWVLTGRSTPVLGLLSADLLLVGAERVDHAAGDAVWFALPVQALAGALLPEEGVDLTRDLGRLRLTDAQVAAADLVPGLDADRVRAAVTALYAADASGVVAQSLRTAVDHVKVREQFGRPVGSFQAVKHKAALLLLASELSAAAAWDAARSLAQDGTQSRLAAAAAAVVGPGRAVDAVLDAVTLLGGIGFTWEHDIHLYWRRAISLNALTGPVPTRASDLGALSLTAARDFDLELEDKDPAFRGWVAEQLDAAMALPPDLSQRPGAWPASGTGPRRTLLADTGLAAPHWPRPYGLDASPAQQAVIAQEFAKRGLERPSSVIGEWAVPTVLAHGEEEQKRRFAVPTLRGEMTWCQLFSEPGAGSDLASLSTRAVQDRERGGWVLNGQKVWTSSAHEADWGICLARSDPQAPRHKGLSCFLVDMHSPGVEVRPLRQATGGAEFNEVFLTDVFVPDQCLVGQAGEGWKLTATTLANERLTIGAGMGGKDGAERLRDAVRSGTPAADAPAVLEELGSITATRIALHALGLRSTLRRLSGLQPGAAASVLKVGSALADRAAAATGLRLLGAEGAVGTDAHGLVQGELQLPSVLIGGGTVEIQLNVIAERILGLPR
ncbi:MULTISPECIES: acyl-CoA dehydrogenase [Streptacidiphilus]|uniref:Acyl-CoA dehydrogenase family protein n=1 Tax=Streptacidiphilus cavernicola TaxID=3342716 RepID=A0ABV6UPK3_9ACTN|nr:acyl-CoA dehydrogenase [Streptacidiphilus jeojiense]